MNNTQNVVKDRAQDRAQENAHGSLGHNSSGSNFSGFRGATSTAPLSAPEEKELILRWQQDQDEQALARLISSYRRLIVKIAYRFNGYKLSPDDLISEGMVGFIKAVDRFEVERELRLSTYAVWWVRAVIQEYVLKSWSQVRIGTTASQKKLFFNLNRMKSQLMPGDTGYLDNESAHAIADRLNVKLKDVYSMEVRMSSRDLSLDAPMGDETGSNWIDQLADTSPDPSQIVETKSELKTKRKWLSDALVGLKPRERKIILARHLSEKPTTLDKLALRFKVSRERIRQIERRAMEKLTQMVKDNAVSAEKTDLIYS